MYYCSQCERKYTSQNSLKRHIHSHSTSQKHRCATCGVTFYRRDLLSRHSKMHSLASIEGSAAVENESTTQRKRCHTACKRCRELRAKCNGQRPCARCITASTPCSYSRHSNRQSRLSIESPASSSNSFLETGLESPDRYASDVEGPNLLPKNPDLPTITSPMPGESGQNVAQTGFQHPSSIPDNSFPLALDYALPRPTTDVDIARNLDPTILAPTVDMVSWPWLHEDLFLPSTIGSLPNSSNLFDDQLFAVNPLFPQMGEPTSHLIMNHAEKASMLSTFPGQVPSMSVFQSTINEGGRDFNQSTRLHGISESIENNGNRACTCSSTKTMDTDIMHAAAEGHPRMQDARPSETRPSNPCQVVHDLINFASGQGSPIQQKTERASFWRFMSSKVSEAFGSPMEETRPQSPVLYHYCELYCTNFGPLWPLLSPQTLDPDSLHPLLFLVLTSIGSMYGGPSACNFGAMMHTRIRVTLCAVLDFDDDEKDPLWLVQARLLTQVAALYFGQPKAFTFAQHLGAILIAQARRMDLFSAKPAERLAARFWQLKGSESEHARLSVWLQLEARRRLAFGIFRADTYTSVLLQTKPLILLEEIDLEFPMCDLVWRSEPMAPGICLQIIEHDRTPGRQLRASDIYRIATDRHEALPPLDPYGQELLMFGLQHFVWRFSHDQEMFMRLTGNTTEDAEFDEKLEDHGYTKPFQGTSLATSSRSHLHTNAIETEAQSIDNTSRLMLDLKDERDRLILTLNKWEHGLPLVKVFSTSNGDRSSLLSSLILYHLAYLQLQAPLETLHQIQYLQADNRSIDQDLITTVCQWANSPRGYLAAERACMIWSLVVREAQVTETKRVRFNLLAFTGLHHVAVVLWAYAGAHNFDNNEATGKPPLKLDAYSARKSTVLVGESESAAIMQSFVELYDCISPARWSSFAKAADKLSTQRFPDKPVI